MGSFGEDKTSQLRILQRIPEGLNGQGRIPFAAVVDQDIRFPLLFHGFFHQLHRVSPHFWKLFHNLRVRFRSFLRSFIRDLERYMLPQRRHVGPVIVDMRDAVIL